MPYGTIKRLMSQEYLFNNMVLIESPFVETTRKGTKMRSVTLALTPTNFVIASESRLKNQQSSEDQSMELSSLYPLMCISIHVFKKSQRQCLKMCINKNVVRYFELEKTTKRSIFWKLWCNHIVELQNQTKVWPYSMLSSYYECINKKCRCQIDDVGVYKSKIVKNHYNARKWTDKHLYLGSKRNEEDENRPIPVAGLGPTEEIKLLYLKPQYFGCWDQSEHWVQCGNSSVIDTPALCDYGVYTYTGGPTSNVTYTSLMTSVCLLRIIT